MPTLLTDPETDEPVYVLSVAEIRELYQASQAVRDLVGRDAVEAGGIARGGGIKTFAMLPDLRQITLEELAAWVESNRGTLRWMTDLPPAANAAVLAGAQFDDLALRVWPFAAPIVAVDGAEPARLTLDQVEAAYRFGVTFRRLAGRKLRTSLPQRPDFGLQHELLMGLAGLRRKRRSTLVKWFGVDESASAAIAERFPLAFAPEAIDFYVGAAEPISGVSNEERARSSLLVLSRLASVRDEITAENWREVAADAVERAPSPDDPKFEFVKARLTHAVDVFEAMEREGRL